MSERKLDKKDDDLVRVRKRLEEHLAQSLCLLPEMNRIVGDYLVPLITWSTSTSTPVGWTLSGMGDETILFMDRPNTLASICYSLHQVPRFALLFEATGPASVLLSLMRNQETFCCMELSVVCGAKGEDGCVLEIPNGTILDFQYTEGSTPVGRLWFWSRSYPTCHEYFIPNSAIGGSAPFFGIWASSNATITLVPHERKQNEPSC